MWGWLLVFSALFSFSNGNTVEFGFWSGVDGSDEDDSDMICSCDDDPSDDL